MNETELNELRHTVCARQSKYNSDVDDISLSCTLFELLLNGGMTYSHKIRGCTETKVRAKWSDELKADLTECHNIDIITEVISILATDIQLLQ